MLKFKRIIAGVTLALTAVAAFALPSARKVEDALAARDYQSARSMTQEVLREKPDSAKAHLFNAYILLKADNNRAAAAEELKNAQRLDQKGDVTGSALYGRTVAALEAAQPQPTYRQPKVYAPQPVQRVQEAPAYVAPQPVVVQHQNSAAASFFKFLLYALIVGLILYALWYWILREEPRVYRSCTGHTYSPPVRAAYSEPAPQVVHHHTSSVAAQPVVVAQAAPSTVVVHDHGGSHMNGMVTGMMMNEMMHHNHHGHSDVHHHHHSDVHGGYIERSHTYEPTPYVATTTPAVDYETNRSSFSSGSDSNWGGSSSRNDDWDAPAKTVTASSSYSSRSDDDGWGSSSSSSSSSSYSSSSYDSGSSSYSSDSGGSDW